MFGTVVLAYRCTPYNSGREHSVQQRTVCREEEKEGGKGGHQVTVVSKCSAPIWNMDFVLHV